MVDLNEKHSWDLYRINPESGEEEFLTRYMNESYHEALQLIADDDGITVDEIEVHEDAEFDDWYWLYTPDEDTYRLQLFQ